MNNQPNQDEMKKKGIQVNPSRDLDYGEKEKKFSGTESEEETSEEINPSELDNSEVELDRGGVEFSGGEDAKNPEKPEQDLHH